jgi:hypothetical protein
MEGEDKPPVRQVSGGADGHERPSSAEGTLAPIEPDPGDEQPLKPGGLQFPKRGAFPTPKAEIEKAKPYVPESAAPEKANTLEE